MVQPQRFEYLKSKALASGVEVVLGFKRGDARAHVQAFRFEASRFTVEQALAQMEQHKLRHISFERASGQVQAYSEEQARDEHGRFGAGGGGSENKAHKGAASVDDLLEEAPYDKSSVFNDEEKRTLADYRGNGYQDVNGYLREGKDHPSVATIDAAFDKALVLSADVIMSRGGRFDDVSGFEVGAEFKDDGYLSTSLDPHVASEFAGGRGVLFKITVKAGTPYIWLNKGEDEVLLGRGTTIRITRIRRERGMLIIEATTGG